MAEQISDEELSEVRYSVSPEQCDVVTIDQVRSLLARLDAAEARVGELGGLSQELLNERARTRELESEIVDVCSGIPGDQITGDALERLNSIRNLIAQGNETIATLRSKLSDATAERDTAIKMLATPATGDGMQAVREAFAEQLVDVEVLDGWAKAKGGRSWRVFRGVDGWQCILAESAALAAYVANTPSQARALAARAIRKDPGP